MPPKDLEHIEFEFEYAGQIYYFDQYKIYYDGEYICHCDLTATNYYGDEEVVLICCKIALSAYYQGYTDGKINAKREIRNALGL